MNDPIQDKIERFAREIGASTDAVIIMATVHNYAVDDETTTFLARKGNVHTIVSMCRDYAQIAALRERLQAQSENAYCDMIGIARKDESLGWEAKVERGEFGRKELDAHCAGSEKLGRHRAFAEACREIDELLTK